MAQRLMYVFFQLHRHKLRSGQVQGLNPGEMRVLRSIKRLDQGTGVMASQLVSLLRVTPPFITQVCNALVKQGLAVRNTDPDDRRAVRLQVTARGEELIAKASQEYMAEFRRLAEELGPEDSEELIRLVQRVNHFLEAREVRNV